MAAQPRDVDAGRVGRLQDRLAGLGLDLDAVDRDSVDSCRSCQRSSIGLRRR